MCACHTCHVCMHARACGGRSERASPFTVAVLPTELVHPIGRHLLRAELRFAFLCFALLRCLLVQTHAASAHGVFSQESSPSLQPDRLRPRRQSRHRSHIFRAHSPLVRLRVPHPCVHGTVDHLNSLRLRSKWACLHPLWYSYAASELGDACLFSVPCNHASPDCQRCAQRCCCESLSLSCPAERASDAVCFRGMLRCAQRIRAVG